MRILAAILTALGVASAIIILIQLYFMRDL